MPKVSPNYRLVILSIATPLQLGIYCNDRLQESIVSEQKTSEVLASLIIELLERYPIQQILYTHGPGSFMAIKLTYIILKTIEIVRGVEFVGVDAFAFNGNRPIKALGNLYFVKAGEEILTQKFEQTLEQVFELPQSISHLHSCDNKPLYIIPAI
ncbi:MAG: hypothetical protein KU38_06090 [Sulfurovum sp. FS08-3]|nr:MAG: hypothetical protein KU38_06090 [Sulfurovum sp. FS08-3]